MVYLLYKSSSSAGEWKEAVWKEVSLSLSQNFPFGGFVWTKNMPDDHRSKMKLHVPWKSVKYFFVICFYLQQCQTIVLWEVWLTDNVSEAVSSLSGNQTFWLYVMLYCVLFIDITMTMTHCNIVNCNILFISVCAIYGLQSIEHFVPTYDSSEDLEHSIPQFLVKKAQSYKFLQVHLNKLA